MHVKIFVKNVTSNSNTFQLYTKIKVFSTYKYYLCTYFHQYNTSILKYRKSSVAFSIALTIFYWFTESSLIIMKNVVHFVKATINHEYLLFTIHSNTFILHSWSTVLWFRIIWQFECKFYKISSILIINWKKTKPIGSWLTNWWKKSQWWWW